MKKKKQSLFKSKQKRRKEIKKFLWKIYIIERWKEIQEIKSQIPLGKIGKPLDIAKTAKWLIEDEFTTGQVISPNGGWIIT